MSKKIFRRLFLLLAIGLFGAMAFPVNAQKSTTVTETRDVDRKDEFLQKYKDVSVLPATERQNFFRNASAKDKANLWKVHLAFYIAKHSDLSKEQKDLILEAISLATPELFEIPVNNSPKEATLQLLTKRALELFPKTEAAEIFANLGIGTAEIGLLQKYQDISALSGCGKISLFMNSSAKDKSKLLKIHMAFYLARRSELSNEQKEVILEAIALAMPELYEIPRDTPEWRVKVDEPLQLLKKRALEVFSKQEGAEIFSSLGGIKPSSDDGGVVSNLDGLTCNCSRQSDWCWGSSCGGGPCGVPDGGCGTFLLYTCNGMC